MNRCAVGVSEGRSGKEIIKRFLQKRLIHCIFCGCGLITIAPTVAAPHSFIVSADGLEVSDQQTGLIWKRCPEGANWDGSTCVGDALPLTAAQALQRASDQSASTGLDWRLPNLKELSSLVDRGQLSPNIDPTAFPSTPETNFWSSSPVAGDPGSVWAVVFAGGFTEIDARQFTLLVRLVRGGR